MGRDIFNPGDVLTAAELQAVQDQGVLRFASDAERDAQWPNPPAGARCAVGDLPYRYQSGWRAEQAYLTCNPGASSNPIPPGTSGVVLLPPVTPDWTPQVFGNGLSAGAIQLRTSGYFRSTINLIGTAVGADSGSFFMLRQRVWRGGQVVSTTEAVHGLAPVSWHQVILESLVSLEAGDELQWTMDNASPAAFNVDNARCVLMIWQVR